VRDGMTPVWVDSRKDSAGARRLVLLLVPLLDGIEQDKLVAIDEFDTHLHPLVSRYLIQTISDPSITHHQVQVLLTSHTTTLMDLDILRRDELWLIQLDEDYASSLRTLLEHRPRRQELVANAYLRGRYGALPTVDMEMTRAALHPQHPQHPQQPPQQQQQSTMSARRKKTH
jgi:AAA15 family ATPase/GTPase